MIAVKKDIAPLTDAGLSKFFEDKPGLDLCDLWIQITRKSDRPDSLRRKKCNAGCGFNRCPRGLPTGQGLQSNKTHLLATIVAIKNNTAPLTGLGGPKFFEDELGLGGGHVRVRIVLKSNRLHPKGCKNRDGSHGLSGIVKKGQRLPDSL